MREAEPGPRAARIASLEAAVEVRRRWRDSGLRVVVTNGCFDLLHVGHVRYLDAARQLGDRLVVAVNDDASARRLKGPRRPIVPLADRMEVLSALRAVSLLVSFGDDTAASVVTALRPDVYVKGGDYDASRPPPEAVLAGDLGARVAYLPYVEGRSTSRLVDRIARRWR